MFEKLQKPLILASKSMARQALMEQTGLSFEIYPANINERAVERDYFQNSEDRSLENLAGHLATQKAMAVSKIKQDHYVIGSDQLLVLDGEQLHKVGRTDQIKAKLVRLRGKTHQLHSAISICLNEKVIWQYVDTAHLTMRNFSEDFLDRYIALCGDQLSKTVGCYELESHGVQLFEKIKGDYFTILGFPIVPLLNFLRQEKIILS